MDDLQLGLTFGNEAPGLRVLGLNTISPPSSHPLPINPACSSETFFLGTVVVGTGSSVKVASLESLSCNS